MLFLIVITLLSLIYHVNGAISSATFKQISLDEHNAIRRKAANGELAGDSYSFPQAKNMLKLKWDDALAAVAQDLADTCVYGHATDTQRETRMDAAVIIHGAGSGYSSGDGIGENIASYSSSGYSGLTEDILQDRIDAWLDNEAVASSFPIGDVNYNNLSCSASHCKHLTQGIWADTQYIGCATKDCTFSGLPGVYVVCNFYPRGNMRGEIVYSAGTTCSNCPAAYPNCDWGICTDTSISPTPAPSSVTTAPTPAPTASCIQISNAGHSFFNQEYSRTGDVNGKPKYAGPNSYTSDLLFACNRYAVWYTIPAPACTSFSYWLICEEGIDQIEDCTAGKWTAGYADSTTTVISGCPSPGLAIDEQDDTSILQPQVVESDIDTFNPTEMHIVLGVLIIVLITMCGMIFGFCYYVKKNKENKNQIENVPQPEITEMAYFENKSTDEQNTLSPTFDSVSAHHEIEKRVQQSLKIRVNGAATMVTKLPTTTPVSPLIDINQNYE